MLDPFRKYPKDYKPNIYTVNLLVKYYEKKYHNKLMDSQQAHKYKKYIEVIEVQKEIIVLDDKMAFPSEKMKQVFLSRIWRKNNIKKSMDLFNIGIREIEIIHKHGTVSYEFDEKKH